MGAMGLGISVIIDLSLVPIPPASMIASIVSDTPGLGAVFGKMKIHDPAFLFIE